MAAMHTIRTTIQPQNEITVPHDEYEYLLEQGLIWDGTPPDPVADPFDARVAERLDDPDSTTREVIDGLVTASITAYQDPFVAGLVADPDSETAVELRAAFGAGGIEAGTRLGLTTFDADGDPVITFESKVGIAGASSPTGLPQGTPYERDEGAHPGEEAVVMVDQNGAIVVRKPSASATPHNSDPTAHPALLTAAGTAADSKVATHDADSTAHPALARKGQGLASRWKSGGYMFVRGTSGVTVVPPNASEYCTPFPDIDRACAVDRIGVEVTGAGSAGALIRLGLRRDDGNGYPGTLLYDAGTFDGTTTGVKGDTAISALAAIALAAGDLLWLSYTCQGAPTTPPTVRAVSGHIPGFSVPLPTHYNRGGIYTQGGVAAALPTSFSATVTATTPGPHGFVKVV